MPFAVFVAVMSVALGAMLALVPGGAGRGAGPIRTFAVTAALAVVVAHLLPSSLHELGLGALIAFVAATIAPSVLRGILRRRKARHGGQVAALELGFAGFLVHRFAEGIAMGAIAGPLSTGLDASVILPLAAHDVPVTAVFVLAIGASRGRRSALAHAAVLAIATVVGVIAASYVPFDVVSGVEPWVAAVVSGLLLDIVLHDLASDPPRSAASRSFDLLAAACGLGLAFLGSHGHHGLHGGASLQAEMGRALVELTLETAPMLLLGLAIAAVLQSLGKRIPTAWLTRGKALSQAVRGAVVGAPIPLCSCSVLPVTRALQARGAGPALVVAFLISTPELGVETIVLTGKFMGWPFAIVRLLGALTIAIVAALVVYRLATGTPPASPEAQGGVIAPGSPPQGGAFARWLHAFDELVFHVGAWTAIGLIVAALVQVLLPKDGLGTLTVGGLDVIAISIVSIPSYVCASSATPLAAVLLAKGVSPGAALAGLLLGPATNLATLAFLRRSYGAGAVAGAVAALLAVTWSIAWLVNRFLPVSGAFTDAHLAQHDHGWFAVGAGILLVLLLARSVWQCGMRGWIGAMLAAPDVHSHDSHGHSHGSHAHDHSQHAAHAGGP